MSILKSIFKLYYCIAGFFCIPKFSDFHNSAAICKTLSMKVDPELVPSFPADMVMLVLFSSHLVTFLVQATLWGLAKRFPPVFS